MLYREDYRRLLRSGGLAVWLAVGLPVVALQVLAPPRARDEFALAAWVAAFLLFLAAFWRATSRRPAEARNHVLPLIAAEGAAVFALVALPPCFGLEGALLVLAAFQLGPILPRPASTAWIAAQGAGLLWLMWLHWGWHWGVVLAFAYLPFQFIADATARLLAQETALRQSLMAANAELEATRELLAQTARMAERARIARDLHDLLGHHLTALSLNLEIASHKASGEVRERVETAQSVTKLLLGDVRGVVGALRRGDPEGGLGSSAGLDLPAGLDLSAALRKLAAGIPRPRVHVEASADLGVEDPAAAETVLRCAQEIVTNAVRHARAENLWLDVERSAEGIRIRARDDGCGAADIAHSVAHGNGLAGLRERFEQRGGVVSFDTAPGQGFRIDAVLPLPGGSVLS